jgi:hypothetical protein
MVDPYDGYERAVSQVTELKVELAQCQTGLRRAQEDNEALLASQLELRAFVQRLQDQNERLRQQLAREQEERRDVAEEHQRQIFSWRSKLEVKMKEFEELQGTLPPPPFEAIQMQLTEEIDAKYRDQMEDLQNWRDAESHRADEEHRQKELMRLEMAQREHEARDQLAEEAQKHALQEQALRRQVATLEIEVERRGDVMSDSSHSRVRVQELEAKVSGLERALQEQDRHYEKERKTSADVLLGRDDEINKMRRRVHELQIEIESQQRSGEKAVLELESLNRDNGKLRAQLLEIEARVATMRPAVESEQNREELAQLKRTMAADRELLNNRTAVAEEQSRDAQTAAKQASMKLRQIEDEMEEREREFLNERDEEKQRHAAEMSNVRAEIERHRQAAEKRSLEWREKETILNRNYEVEKSRAESLNDDLTQSQLAQKDAERKLGELRLELERRLNMQSAEFQKQLATLETESTIMREHKATRDRECSDHERAAEAARTALQHHQNRGDVLHAACEKMKNQLDAERAKWSLDADESQAAALRLAEERRAHAVQQLTEEHKRQLAKMHASSKRALQKGARKRQELRQRYQELAKRAQQLQEEKATAIRICEENKAAYELRLTELGLLSRLGLSTVGVGAADIVGGGALPAVLRADAGISNSGMLHKRELRGIMERLEQNAEKLQSSSPAVS